MNFQGYIDGIDVIATPGGATRCLAFVNEQPGSNNYIQVETSDLQLQAALSLASARACRVEVSYTAGTPNVLQRVRLLDR